MAETAAWVPSEIDPTAQLSVNLALNSKRPYQSTVETSVNTGIKERLLRQRNLAFATLS